MKPNFRKANAFTVIELMIVIAIIVTLMAILIPTVGYVKTQAKKSAAVALLNSIGTGLEQYHSDFNSFPPSSPTNAYTLITPSSLHFDRCGLMLAEGLVGFLPGNIDGAGPTLPPVATYANDPGYGFRTRLGGIGKVYGPYAQAGGASWKVLPSASDGTTPATDSNGNSFHQVFVDIWGDEILYFRANPGNVNGVRQNYNRVFSDGSGVPLFNSDDAGLVGARRAFEDDNGGKFVPVSDPNTSGAFLKLLGAKVNDLTNPGNIGAMILGRDSYILVSAGPDRVYFTADDIVQAGK